MSKEIDFKVSEYKEYVQVSDKTVENMISKGEELIRTIAEHVADTLVKENSITEDTYMFREAVQSVLTKAIDKADITHRHPVNSRTTVTCMKSKEAYVFRVETVEVTSSTIQKEE